MNEDLLKQIAATLSSIDKKLGDMMQTLEYIEASTSDTTTATEGIKAEVDELRIAYEAINFPDEGRKKRI